MLLLLAIEGTDENLIMDIRIEVKGPGSFFDNALKGVSAVWVVELGIVSQRMVMIARGKMGNRTVLTATHH